MSSQTRLAISDRRSGAERQGHDRGVAPAAGRGGRGRLLAPAAALGQPGSPHQIERSRVVQRGGLAGCRLGCGGVLAGDPAQRVRDQRRLRRVRPPAGARRGRDRRRRGLHRRQLAGLGPLGEVGGHLRRVGVPTTFVL